MLTTSSAASIPPGSPDQAAEGDGDSPLPVRAPTVRQLSTPSTAQCARVISDCADGRFSNLFWPESPRVVGFTQAADSPRAPLYQALSFGGPSARPPEELPAAARGGGGFGLELTWSALTWSATPPKVAPPKQPDRGSGSLGRTSVRDPWTVIRHDGPNHLGLRCNALPEHQMALITSGCTPSRPSPRRRAGGGWRRTAWSWPSASPRLQGPSRRPSRWCCRTARGGRTLVRPTRDSNSRYHPSCFA